MEISDFTFTNSSKVKGFFETIMTAKNGVRMGVIYQAGRQAPDNAIFQEFLNNKNNFFIEVDSEIVVDKPVVEVLPEKPAEIPEKVLTPPEEAVKVGV